MKKNHSTVSGASFREKYEDILYGKDRSVEVNQIMEDWENYVRFDVWKSKIARDNDWSPSTCQEMALDWDSVHKGKHYVRRKVAKRIESEFANAYELGDGEFFRQLAFVLERRKRSKIRANLVRAWLCRNAMINTPRLQFTRKDLHRIAEWDLGLQGKIDPDWFNKRIKETGHPVKDDKTGSPTGNREVRKDEKAKADTKNQDSDAWTALKATLNKSAREQEAKFAKLTPAQKRNAIIQALKNRVHSRPRQT